MAETLAEPLDDFSRTTTHAAAQERRKLRRRLGRADGLVMLLCAIVSLDTLGAVANGGAQSFTWLLFLAVFFFLPYGLLTAELGSAFPQEGGPYVWVRLAFGRLAGAIASLSYWVCIPVWLGGGLTITAVVVFNEFFFSVSGVLERVIALVFIWAAVTAALTANGPARWIPRVGAYLRVGVLAFFTLTVVIYAIEHGVQGFGAGDFTPSWTVFIAVVPVLFFNFLGFEVPSNAAEEMRDPQRDVPASVLRAGIAAVLLYAVPIAAILLVLPTEQVTGLGGFIDAMKAALTVYGGHVGSGGAVVLSGAGQVLGTIAALAFIFTLCTSGSTWLLGTSRTQAVASYDGAGPRWLGHFSSRLSAPVNITVLGGVIASAIMLITFSLTEGDAAKYFSVVLALAISAGTISYLLIFPALVKLRMSDVERPFSVPGGRLGAWVCSGLCTLCAGLALVVLVYPGFGTSNADASLPEGFEGQRGVYTLSQAVPLILLLLVGVLFYYLGRDTRRETLEPAAATVPPFSDDAAGTISA